MPVFSAICDIVTARSPCSATSPAVVPRIASRTSRRCASIVSFHSFGTSPLYATAPVETLHPRPYTLCLDRLTPPAHSNPQRPASLPSRTASHPRQPLSPPPPPPPR